MNLSPHFAHFIKSKSKRLTRSGVIVNPHLGQVLSMPRSRKINLAKVQGSLGTYLDTLVKIAQIQRVKTVTISLSKKLFAVELSWT